MSEQKLTAKQKMFIQEYLVDLNATQAAIRAGYSKKTAAEIGRQNLIKLDEHIQKAMKEREKRTEITQDMVLRQFWDIASANPNEIIQMRRLNCRYCHGEGYAYQWKDEDEYKRAVQSAIKYAREESEKQGKTIHPEIPSDAGGYGYDPLADPNPDCPKCDGEGVPDLHIADTRKLSPAARRLYAGIKQTQSGIEVRMHDQLKALEYIARHLGMFTDRVEQKIEVTHRLEDLL